jgi:hypothetical protein
MASYVRYAADVETIADDEADIADKIVKVMSKGSDIVREREGRALRSSHAKAHGLAFGELKVSDDLPAELRQGLFASPKSYPVVIRLAHVPGELLDDRKVSTPRGFALKVLGVDGPRFGASTGEATQDWLLDTGENFIAANATTFLGEITMTEASTPMPEGVKSIVSVVSKATNAALHALGADSANMDFFGHPKFDPLTETYYSQAPIRYGDYIAKLRVRPLSLSGAENQTIDIAEENGLRAAVANGLAQPVQFAVEVQLCTDLQRMPVEDAHKKWSQEESPFRKVGRISLPAQEAYSEGRQAAEEKLSFNPAHTLAAHQPLGSVNRARLRVYEVMAARRREANGLSTAEPAGLQDLMA